MAAGNVRILNQKKILVEDWVTGFYKFTVKQTLAKQFNAGENLLLELVLHEEDELLSNEGIKINHVEIWPNYIFEKEF